MEGYNVDDFTLVRSLIDMLEHRILVCEYDIKTMDNNAAIINPSIYQNTYLQLQSMLIHMQNGPLTVRVAQYMVSFTLTPMFKEGFAEALMPLTATRLEDSNFQLLFKIRENLKELESKMKGE